jgi:heme/copper-type cytochrome/quinol oxidase subunit 2
MFLNFANRRKRILACFGMIGGSIAIMLAVTLLGLGSKTVTELDAEVVGSDYRLFFRYPGNDGKLHTSDDRIGTRNFYVPEGIMVRLRLTSRDYAYLVEVPDANVYELAAPNLVFVAEFAAPSLGQHELLASQMCGYDHPELLGKLNVQTQAEFWNTMASLPPAPFNE